MWRRDAEGSHTFQNGLSNPDFRCHLERLHDCARGGVGVASPWRKSTSAGKDVSGVLQLYCRGGYKISPRGFIEPYALADLDSATPVGPSSSPGILQKVRTASSPRRGLPTRSYSVPVQSAILASVDTDTVAD
ncbi:hypothetical protein GEV33_002043 [Tenebrio molitor]|uniref:Uncharacterized protein n=1 Tax=Tenebrio molitor TaxID=7067 RepID=A0A8J6LJ22_TENMO|nr:hypothetical protein GEV33_002043 [Tenebrio molitor]